MHTESEATIDNDAIEVTDIPTSRNEPTVHAIHSGQRENDDDQKWSWIYHCDQVISYLPIGLA